eukprot:scaffold14224_cov62-Phaeocystis_antarctica.AAC.1
MKRETGSRTDNDLLDDVDADGNSVAQARDQKAQDSAAARAKLPIVAKACFPFARASAAVPPTETLPRTYAIGVLGMLVVLSCALALCPTARLLSTARLSTARSGVAVALDAGNLVQFEKRKGEVSIGALRQCQSGPLALGTPRHCLGCSSPPPPKPPIPPPLTVQALVSPDEKTKRNWLVVDSAGTSQSVPPKAIRLAVPGAKASKAAEVAAHESAAAEALEKQADVLDDAWDLALDDATTELELHTLAELFFGSAGSTDCYAALVLLESPQGRCLFKVKVVNNKDGGAEVCTCDARAVAGGLPNPHPNPYPNQVGFLPRPREEAAALKAQLEREDAVAEQQGQSVPARLVRLLRARLAAPGGSRHPGREAGPLGAQQLP